MFCNFSFIANIVILYILLNFLYLFFNVINALNVIAHLQNFKMFSKQYVIVAFNNLNA